MIIEHLLNVVFGIFAVLTLPIDIPDMPPDMQYVCMQAMEYINSGLSIMGNFFDLPYLLRLFALVVAVEAGILIYKFIIWFVKKIPFLGIK